MRGWLGVGMPLVLVAVGLGAAAPVPVPGGMPLAQAVTHWSGVAATVAGQGSVRIGLPADSPVSEVMAEAAPGRHDGEAGWTLRSVRLPSPSVLRDGSRLRFGSQSGEAWLGTRTAAARVADTDVVLAPPNAAPVTVDRLSAEAAQTGTQVSGSVRLTGVHAQGALSLVSAVSVSAHTTPDGASALARWAAEGRQSGAVPVSLDGLTARLGPAEITANGQVRLVGPEDREGTLLVQATQFDALMNALPQDQAALKLLPVLLVLRQLATKTPAGLQWTVQFAGRRVLVGGLDLTELAKF